MMEKKIIENIVEESIIGTDIFLVDINISPMNEITVEVDSDNGISIDDCIKLSKRIEETLDRDTEDFELEVGSAGLTSPLKIPRQYLKYEGKKVEVLVKDGKKYEGILLNSNNNGFSISVSKQVKLEGAKRKTTIEEVMNFKFDEIKYTKYQITIK